MPENLEENVAAHYRRAGLLEDILSGLAASGADPAQPRIEDLAPVDEFHTAGRKTTVMALKMMPLRAGMQVLDAGCGIGGTARVLAAEHDCQVTGVDLTPEYVEVARVLTERTGLTERCRFLIGSVLDIPCPDAAFEAAISFHVAMNIGDRQRFYGELARVLRPGAPLCIFDVMKGPADGMSYPVPWAMTEETSFLRTPAETRQLLESTGFEVAAEKSLHAFALEFFREALARAAQADRPPPVGLHLLTGKQSPEKFANYLKGLEARQLDPAIMIAVRR